MSKPSKRFVHLVEASLNGQYLTSPFSPLSTGRTRSARATVKYFVEIYFPDEDLAARRPAAQPRYMRARDLAGAVSPASEATILAAARKAAIGRKLGRAIVFSPADVDEPL